MDLKMSSARVAISSGLHCIKVVIMSDLSFDKWMGMTVVNYSIYSYGAAAGTGNSAAVKIRLIFSPIVI